MRLGLRDICLWLIHIYCVFLFFFRHHKEKLWDKAVLWIANNESRVRVETRMISGEQYSVWNWVQPEPPPTEVQCVYVILEIHLYYHLIIYVTYMYVMHLGFPTKHC